MIIIKILYVACFNILDPNYKGILKKIFSQIKVLSKKNELFLYTLIGNKPTILNQSQIKSFLENNTKLQLNKYNIIKSRILFILKSTSIFQKYDIIYLRFNSVFSFIRFTSKNKESLKILEIPTPLKNYKNELKNKSLIKKIGGNFILKKINTIKENFNFIISISEKNFGINNEIILQNGIDVNSIKIKKDKKDNKKLNLLSIANNSKGHGYDRIIKGLYNYYENNPEKEVYYHCVGEGSELGNLKKLTKELNMDKYVFFYGTKTGKELDDIVNKCDIAFGSLANHRKNMYIDSALKNREYCARGIPFVIASEDKDFPNSFKYVYRIPQDESPVNIDKIIEFYNSIKNENYIDEMRKYAEENLTWDAKMKPVIEKINELIKERNFDK